jgi:hypothetical protein
MLKMRIPVSKENEGFLLLLKKKYAKQEFFGLFRETPILTYLCDIKH